MCTSNGHILHAEATVCLLPLACCGASCQRYILREQLSCSAAGELVEFHVALLWDGNLHCASAKRIRRPGTQGSLHALPRSPAHAHTHTHLHSSLDGVTPTEVGSSLTFLRHRPCLDVWYTSLSVQLQVHREGPFSISQQI